jgi:hypothetical protein
MPTMDGPRPVRRAFLVGLPTLAVLGLLYAGFARTAPPSPPPLSRTFRLQLENDRLVAGPSILMAHEGDTVTLRVLSNRRAVVHLHEHEQQLVLELEPGREASGSFDASLAGRFGVHLVGEDGSFTEIAALEVMPR